MMEIIRETHHPSKDRHPSAGPPMITGGIVQLSAALYFPEMPSPTFLNHHARR